MQGMIPVNQQHTQQCQPFLSCKMVLLDLFVWYVEPLVCSIVWNINIQHGNFRRWQSESFRISNLPPQMKKVSIGKRYYKPQKILPLWWKRRNLPRNAPLVSALHWLQLKLFWSVCHDGWLTNDSEDLRHLSFYGAPSCNDWNRISG